MNFLKNRIKTKAKVEGKLEFDYIKKGKIRFFLFECSYFKIKTERTVFRVAQEKNDPFVQKKSETLTSLAAGE